MPLPRQLAVLRAWLPVIIASTALFGIVAYYATSLQPKLYEAKATLIVGQSLSGANPDYSQILASQRLSATYASIATLPSLLSAVIEDLGLSVTPEQLAARVHVDAPLDTTLITITAQGPDGVSAALLANEVAKHLIEESPTVQGGGPDNRRSVDADLTAMQSQITSTEARIQSLGALASPTPAQTADLVTLQGQLVTLRSAYASLLTFASTSAANALGVVQPAVAPSIPVAPRPLLNAQLGALLGLMLALIAAFGKEFWKGAVRDSDDVRQLFGLPTLGSIAPIKGRGPGGRTKWPIARQASSVADEYRTVRANIGFSSLESPITSFLIASAGEKEGRTTTAVNLALVFAQSGRRVLLVDGDLRNPALHEALAVPNMRGLTTLLRSDAATLEDVAQTTSETNLTILTSGPLPANATDLLTLPRMRTVLDRLVARHDLLIFDSPPLRGSSDAAILSSLLDATILVVSAGRSRRRIVAEALGELSVAGATTVGVVLNRLPGRRITLGDLGRVEADWQPVSARKSSKGSAS